jgi:carboxyl-terminal processing protease
VSLPRRAPWLLALLCCSGLVVCTSSAYAIPDEEIRKLSQRAEELEQQPEPDWEQARAIYELLITQKDLGLRIRDRYHNAQRRCWQLRRHQDISYRKEVLSIEYAQAQRICRVINRTLLDGSVDKKKLDPTKLFHKGLEELDAALANPLFVKEHVPEAKRGAIAAFRAELKKNWGDMNKLSREEAAKQIGEVAMAAEFHLNLSATVVTMEFACGACYAIDEYTVYLTPNQLRELAQALARTEVIGVGMILALSENKIIVQEVLMGSPADQAAIAKGDQVVSVGKRPVADLQLNLVKEMLEGPLGSDVEVEIVGPEDPAPRRVMLKRQRAMVSGIYYGKVPNTAIGYLKITSFTDSTVQEVDEALRHLTQSYGVKGLILDLRDNNGGVFESAIDTARRFLERGIITSTLNQDTKASFVYHAKNPDPIRIPMAVLVNGDTASAAEVLAGALKDNNRAVLIGQTTFGKGCTQTVLKLPNATGGIPTGGMKLTTARFFSPKGVAYSGRGITPHYLIDESMPASQMMGDPYIAKGREEIERATMPK